MSASHSVVFALVINEIPECFSYSDESTDYEESLQYGKALDLRGNLRQQFGLVASQKYPDISSVCSPISALLLLGQMALGAHGSGLEELNKVIGIKNDDYVVDEAHSVKRHLSVLIKDLEDLPGAVLNVATRLYVSEEKKIYKNYTKAAESIFKTSVEKVNFRDSNAAAENINHWVAHQTHGMIEELISPADISTSASVIAVNALFFHGKWDQPFTTVEPRPFYSPNGVKNIPMMIKTKTFNYGRSKSLSAELVEIPYTGMKSTFLIVLPKSKSGLPKLLKKLKKRPNLLDKAIKKMENLQVILSIPKFRTESHWDLKSLYKDVGLSSIFQRKKSGLTSIVQGEEMEISGAIQKAVIEVNELGTKGAAASGLVYASSTKPIKFTADRPFLFYVLVNSQQVGLSSIFQSKKSDLTSIMQGEEIEISGAIQKAIIVVNGLRTKGAAASIVVFALVISEKKCFSYSDEYTDSEESLESREYGKKLDFRGTLRKGFGLVASQKYPDISSVCSPLSALLLLGQMALGAHGSGLEELNKAIGITNEDYVVDEADSVKRHLYVLIKDLDDLPGAILNVASRLYVSEEKKLYNNYTKAAETIFKTSVEKANFRDPNAAASSINRWVTQQTYGMIKEIISPAEITKSTSLIAVNAIFFCGKWDEPFQTVEPRPFYSPNGVKYVPMMSKTDMFNYGRSKTLSAELVEIPYAGMKSTFLIVLPKRKSGLPKLLKKLKKKPKLLDKAIRKMENVKVTLTFPKFKIESHWDLKSLYKDVGLSSIFHRKKSGLTSIVQGEQMEISGAVQKVTIEVNELGTKGAAVSVVIFGLVFVDLMESRRDTDKNNNSAEESEEINKYEKVFDLRGTLRKQFGLIAALQYPAISSICSPISALLPLGKMALGAHGSSLQELNEVIGIRTQDSHEDDSDDGSETLNRHLSSLIKDLKDLEGVTLDVASILYVSEDKKLYKNYTKLAKSIFKSSIEKTSFKNTVEAASTINRWVSHQTHGMISELISPDAISPQTSLIAVNAIYFEGKWAHAFTKVEPGAFYSPSGVKNIPMMSQTDWLKYGESEALSVQLIEIPYVKQKSSFLIVLPTQQDGLKSLLKNIKKNPQLLGKAINEMMSVNIRLTIPKFKTESVWDLTALYKKIGLSSIFDSESSGLSAIVQNENLVVDAAIQKAIIEVTEQGTKASAASATVTLNSPRPKVVKADHPFLFYVMANSQQLFTGTFN